MVMNEKERILEILKTSRQPMHTANIWFELSFNVEQPESDQSNIGESLIELAQEGHVRHSIVSCLDYWTYRQPGFLSRFIDWLRGR
jgi:hypothetical protein